MPLRSASVAFRLAPEAFAELERLAAASNTSPGLFAKRLVQDRIAGGRDVHQLEAKLEQLAATQARHHRSLALAFEALILNAAEDADADQVKRWVASIFEVGE